MSMLRDMWRELGGISNRVDRLEGKVRKVWERPKAKGRETPFWGEKSFLFEAGATEPLESPLVQSAGVVTRVTRLTYCCRMLNTQNALVIDDDQLSFVSMRQTPRGMIGITNEDGGVLFDFEWTYIVGSTERKYSTALPSPDGWNWLSRLSLSNPESGSNLLFNPQHPLILRTNEFLTFRVRPIVWASNTVSGVELPRVSVNIQFAGYRTFGYEV